MESRIKNLREKRGIIQEILASECKYVIIRICPQLYFSDTLFS